LSGLETVLSLEFIIIYTGIWGDNLEISKDFNLLKSEFYLVLAMIMLVSKVSI